MNAPTIPRESEVIITPHSTLYAGPDAVSLLRAIALRASIRFYAKTGMKTTRMATPTLMLSIATEYTGKPYKGKTKFDNAIADLDTWIATMKAAMPITINGEKA